MKQTLTTFIRISWSDGRYWNFGIVKSDGKLCWEKKTGSKLENYTRKDGMVFQHRQMTATTTISMNPFPRWYSEFAWWLTYQKLRLTGKLHMQCQGCGEGIAKWKIRDPNQGHGNKWLNCCNKCVGFYGWRIERLKIVRWKQVQIPDGFKTTCSAGDSMIKYKAVWKSIGKKKC